MAAKYNRNSGKTWTKKDITELKKLAKENTPTRVIGLKLGRTESAVRSKASDEDISLKPVNQSPYNRRIATSALTSQKGRKNKRTNRKASRGTNSGGPRKK